MFFKFKNILIFCVIIWCSSADEKSKKSKCPTKPLIEEKVNKVLKECEDDLKITLVKEAFSVVRHTNEWHHPHESYPYTEVVYQNIHNNAHLIDEYNYGINRRIKRSEPWYDSYNHVSFVSHEDKFLAGCLLHCVYHKNHAVDKHGWPTLDGLVNFYTDGTNDHGFFLATLRAVDYCLKGASIKNHINHIHPPEKAQHCDLSFDIFDCVLDKITEYCFDYKN